MSSKRQVSQLNHLRTVPELNLNFKKPDSPQQDLELAQGETEADNLENAEEPRSSQPASLTQRLSQKFGEEKKRQTELRRQVEDPELTNKVWYHNLFSEQKRKDNRAFDKLQGEDYVDISQQYLTQFGDKRNPDILLPQGAFLQGRSYKKTTFLKKEEEAMKLQQEREKLEEEEDGEEKEPEEEDLEEGEAMQVDQFKRMKSQTGRYFAEPDITVRCHNCKEVGHYARNCQNARKLEACLLCGKEGHSSFDCYEKLCFRCNKTGHEIRDCEA